jgi:Zn-dependent peptidase ImmA (M78 family)
VSQNADRIREVLDRSVAELVAIDAPLPVDVHRISQSLGIEITYAPAAGQKSSIRLTNAPRITVGNRDLHPHRERFTVAHELGHWILWKRLNYLPTSKSEYWDLEAHCDYFASHLLIPPAQLAAFMRQRDTRDPVPRWIFAPQELQRLAEVSWETAARRIATDPQSNVDYLRIGLRSRDMQPVISRTSVTDARGHYVGRHAIVDGAAILQLLGLDQGSTIETDSDEPMYQPSLFHPDYVAPRQIARSEKLGVILATLQAGKIRFDQVKCEYLRAASENGPELTLCFASDDPGIRIDS